MRVGMHQLDQKVRPGGPPPVPETHLQYLLTGIAYMEFRHRVDVTGELGEGGILALGGTELKRRNRHH